MWSWLSKSKERYILKLQEEWRQEHAQQLQKLAQENEAKLDLLRHAFNKKVQDVELAKDEMVELEKRIEHKREELARLNDDLLARIRLEEAKASPATVWTEAFTLGFSKAWDMMVPLMTQGVAHMEKTIRDKVLEEELGRLNGNP